MTTFSMFFQKLNNKERLQKLTRTKVLLDPKNRFEYLLNYQIEKIQSDMRTKMAFGQQTGLTRLTKLTSCCTILEI